MDVFYFLLLVLLFLVSFPVVLLLSYLWMKTRINSALRQYLVAEGYVVTKIQNTNQRFKVNPTHILERRFLSGAVFVNGSTGSGIHYREVAIKTQDNSSKTILAATEVRFFSPVDFHIKEI